MKENLDYLLDNPSLAQVWVELKLTKTNPLHDDYYRMEYADVTYAEAEKIAQANCKGIVLECQGEEYTTDWNGKRMPGITQCLPDGTIDPATPYARLWCSEAWKVMAQRRAKESKKIEERTARLEFVIRYFTESLGQEPAESRELAYALKPDEIDSLAKMAAKDLKA